jgi:hypothetical protein
VNASEPDPRFVLLQPDTIFSEKTGYLTAVHKNVYFDMDGVERSQISCGGPPYGDARNEAFLTFSFVSTLTYFLF